MPKQDDLKIPEIKEWCIWCWVCVALCDDFFDMDEEWKAFVKQWKDSTSFSCIDDAIWACPINVICYKD